MRTPEVIPCARGLTAQMPRLDVTESVQDPQFLVPQRQQTILETIVRSVSCQEQGLKQAAQLTEQVNTSLYTANRMSCLGVDVQDTGVR